MLYMVSTGAARGDWFFATWCAVIFGFGISSLISTKIRTRAIQQFAAAHNLSYAGGVLPDGLMLSLTSFDPLRSSVSNCLHGELRSIPLALFDLSHKRGKGTVSQTVVSFPRKGSNAIPEAPIDAVGSYQFEAAGEWIIAWIPRRVVKIEELEDWCIELHTLASDLLAEARGESDVRPRLFRWMT
jgi:hypothetical protein